MDTFSAAVMLFLIMDPLGNLPIFMSVLRHVEPKRRRAVLVRELVFALAIMMLFLFTGEAILNFLNLRTESVSIAGGIILFLIAIKMIFPSPGGTLNHDAGQEPFVVPLAIPLIAGPSVLAALLLLSHSDPTRMTDWTIALVAAWAVSSLILLSSGICHRILGERGLIAVERLMGMVLVMLSVQMFLDGVAAYLK
ncbi:YhgN family NAAT transporter [Ferrimonas senticii]|uniref:YhgN family NAAT transporter n=1 Tax=Ferrimonas senticii TaxID=394566 RepID=UPI000407E723|nr:YhgN family NAAT transporter [Ferrimonas senticii]